MAPWSGTAATYSSARLRSRRWFSDSTHVLS